MSNVDGAAPLLEPTPATPAPGTQPDAPGPDDVPELDVDGEAEESEPELIDWEEGGKKYKLPKAVQPNLLRQSDYSRKMAELAVSRKEIEDQRAEAPKWRETEEAHQRNLGQLQVIDGQLKDFDKIDWTAWLSHPDANQRGRAIAAQAQRFELDRKRSSLREAIQVGQQKYETETKRVVAERIQATQAFAEKEIAGWSPERNNAIGELLKGMNLSQRAAKVLYENMEPGLLQILDHALDGHQARQARAKAKTAASAAEGAAITPLNVVKTGGTSGSRKPLAKMEMAEYVAARKAGRRA